MNAKEYNEVLSALYAKVEAANAKIKSFCLPEERGPMGLTPEKIRTSPEYRAAKADYDTAFQALRKYTKAVPNKVKREAAKLRRNKVAV